MEDSTRAVPEVLAKRPLRGYAPQIINGSAEVISNTIAPRPGKWRTAGLLRRLPEWTPMRWRPAAERGKRAETWFECEYCGGRKLTFRHMSMSEAMRQHP